MSSNGKKCFAFKKETSSVASILKFSNNANGDDEKTREIKENLTQWDILSENVILQKYSFDDYFAASDIHDFIDSLFSNNEIQDLFNSAGGFDLTDLQSIHSDIERLSTDMISCEALTRLVDNGIVHKSSGQISKMIEEPHNGFLICNQLQNILINEEAPRYETFSDDERKEFLIHTFKHLVIGGNLCQYDDLLEPYIGKTFHKINCKK